MKISQLLVLTSFFLPLSLPGAQTELHWKVCESPDQLHQKLPGSGKPKQRRSYYFDDSQQSHYRHGVVLRFRMDPRKGATSTLKVRGVASIPGEWEGLKGYKCEADYRGGRLTHTCALKRVVSPATARKFIQGKAHPAALYDSKQRGFAKAGGKSIHWRNLHIAGPLTNTRWKWKHFEGEHMSARGKTYLEVSLRTNGDPRKQYLKWQRGFEKRGVRFCKDSPSKTRWALAHFLGY